MPNRCDVPEIEQPTPTASRDARQAPHPAGGPRPAGCARRLPGGPSSLAFALAAVLGAVALSLPVARPVRAAGCDGFADYGDEVAASQFVLESETLLGDGFSEVEISFELANTDVGDFISARAFPKPGEAAAALGIVDTLAEAEFGALAPLVNTPSSASLRLRVPSANVAALLADLAAGVLPLTVHADERDVLAPGVSVIEWTSSEDAFYAFARDTFTPPVNLDPGPPPYAPGAQFSIVLVALGDGVPSIFDDFDPQSTLFVVPDSYVPTEIPVAMQYARVMDVIKSDEDGGGLDASDGVTSWTVLLERSDGASLPDLFTSGSFCTGTSTHIDLPVQATRLNEVFGEAQDPEERDAAPQPIHFNGTDIDAVVKLSGQVEGHVLKPSLELRLRAGKVRAVLDIDTDVSFTAELRAEATLPFDDEVSLYDLCFPLPDLIAGPVPIGLNLQLEHVVGAMGELHAGAIIGLQKTFRGGHTVGFDGRRPPGDKYFSEPHHAQPQPVEFTAPQLLEDTGVHVEVYTELRTTLRVGAQYPLCDTGAGGFVGARGRGILDVRPLQSPWWTLSHEAEVFAGIDVRLLGIEIDEHETDFTLFPGAETLDSGGPLLLAGSLGGGSSAPTLAGAASLVPPGTTLASGTDQRWALAIDTLDLPNGIDHTAVSELADGTVVLVSHESIPGLTPLLRFDANGRLLSSQKYVGNRAPKQIVPLADGSFFVAGEPAWVAHHAADGALLEGWDYDVTDIPGGTLHCVIGAIAAIEDAPGQYGFVAVGHIGRGDIRQRDACAFRAEADGDLVWARTYGADREQELYDVLVAQDGTFAAAGEIKEGPDVYTEHNPFLVKLDPSDGQIVWARSIPIRGRSISLNAIAETSDGTLIGAGGGLRHISDNGAAFVVRIDADGENVHHALVMQDETWDMEVPEGGFVDTQGGDTPYDEIFDLVATNGGVVFVGHSGLGDDKSAFVGKLNDHLGIEWMRHYDGALADTLDGVTRADGGYLVSGFSRSLAANVGEDDTQAWLMKLATDGGADLYENAGAITRFVSPGIRATSSDASLVTDGIVSMEPSLAVVDALLDSTVSAATSLLEAPFPQCVTRLTASGVDSDLDACETTYVPEPGSGAMLAAGAVMLGLLGRRARPRR